MHPPAFALTALMALAIGAALLLHGCQESPEPTGPDVGTIQTNRTLTVEAGGTGSGTVTTPQVGEVQLVCEIVEGKYAPEECTQTYGFNSSVTLTATPQSTSTFAGWSGDCGTVTGTTCTVTMSSDRTATASWSAPAGIEAAVGKWTAPSSTPIIGVHLTQMANGKAIAWGHAGEPYIWSAPGGGFTRAPANTCGGGNCELFCAGHTFLADGRLLVAGGHDEALGDNNGITQASIFDGDSWSATASMRYRRGYRPLVDRAESAGLRPEPR